MPASGSTGPSRYRLRWDAQGLVLEERLDEGAYTVRESSGITVPPAPLAAVHPELEVVLDQSLKQFRRSWLNGSGSIDITLSPPWGTAWLLPIGNLPEDAVEEQVVWELQQRLDSPLDEYIYAWHPLDDQVYAIVIRPELLAFWDRLSSQNNLDVGTVTLLAGLVEPAIERGADLMPLFRLWADRTAGVEGEEDQAEFEEFQVDDEAETRPDNDVAEPYHSENLTDDEADEALRALIDESGDGSRGYKKRAGGGRTRRWLLPLILVVLLLGTGATAFVLRDRIPLVERAVNKAIALVDNIRDRESQETGAATGDQPSFSITTIPSQDVPPPPELPSTAGILGSMYELADMNNVDLFSAILQGSSIQLEVIGELESIQSWSSALSRIENAPSILLNDPAPLAAGAPVTLNLLPTAEELMTTDQFTDLVHSLGIESYGRHAFSADRDAMARLLSVLRGERRRPFRLSIHHVPGDRYLLVMFP